MMDWKEKLGAAFNMSEAPQEPNDEQQSAESRGDARQQQGRQVLHVLLDKKGRHGKQATLVVDWVCDDEALKQMCRKLKTLCGVGGSARGGEILLQGDQRDKVTQFLRDNGFNVK